MKHQVVSDHRARTPKQCDHCGRTIEPGQLYTKVVVFPGEGSYPIGGGDYESVDWPFSTMITHDQHGGCLDYVLPGEPGYDELIAFARAEEAEVLESW